MEHFDFIPPPESEEPAFQRFPALTASVLWLAEDVEGVREDSRLRGLWQRTVAAMRSVLSQNSRPTKS